MVFEYLKEKNSISTLALYLMLSFMYGVGYGLGKLSFLDGLGLFISTFIIINIWELLIFIFKRR